MRLRSTICIMQQTPSACLDDGRLIYSSSVTCPFYYRETQFQMFLNVESLFLISFNISFFFFCFSAFSSKNLSYQITLFTILQRQSISRLLDRHQPGAQRESMYKRFPITLDHRLTPSTIGATSILGSGFLSA